MEELLQIVTVGHVDHGKSTVLGRLLADAGGLPKGKLEAVRENCRRNARPFEYAFLADALKNEQAQGITIDTARVFFRSKKRPYLLLDAPGHIEFLKNMVTGASHADAALLVIDAARGIEENTRRHGYFLSMLGVGQVAVLVNKMDLVGWQQDVFEQIRAEFTPFLEELGIHPAAFLPVSGREGDNIAVRSERMPWYEGLTVLEQMDAFVPPAHPDSAPLRMPVQGVYRFTEHGDDRRIVAGTVESGTLRAGDRLVFLPSGKKTTAQTLEVFNAPVPEAFPAGSAAGFTMSEQIFVGRGEVACRVDEPLPAVGVRLLADVFWLGKNPLDTRKIYHLKCGTARAEMKVERILQVVDASTLTAGLSVGQVPRQRSCGGALSRNPSPGQPLAGESGQGTRPPDNPTCGRNEVCRCILKLDRPMAFDLAGSGSTLSRFVIVDEYEISGGGSITKRLDAEDYDRRNIRWSAEGVGREERFRATGQKGMVVWMTGLSGAGKTTLARQAERRLTEEGICAQVLDGDDLRRGLCSDLGFGEEDRRENIRRAGEAAKLLAEAGVVTLVTLISPLESAREAVRERVGAEFIEVDVKAEVSVCAERDPKGLYKKALAGEIPEFTGVSAPYEPPEHPELVLDTERLGEAACVEALLTAIHEKREGRIATGVLRTPCQMNSVSDGDRSNRQASCGGHLSIIPVPTDTAAGDACQLYPSPLTHAMTEEKRL